MDMTFSKGNRRPGDVSNRYGDIFLSHGAYITRGTVLLTEEQYMVASQYGWNSIGYDRAEKRVIAKRNKRRPLK